MSDSTKSTQTAQPKKKELSFALKYFYGVGDAGFNLMSNIETFFFVDFLNYIAMFTPAVAALINSIFSIFDACISWIYGGILNGTKAKKWGRYRSWLIILPWAVPLIYMLMFVRVSDNEMVSAIVIIIAAIVSHFMWNIPYVANVTLISVVGATPDDRATLASSRGTWNNIGSMAFSYLGAPLAGVMAGIVGGNLQWAATAFILGLLFVLGYFAHFKMTDGYEVIETEEAEKTSHNKIKISEMFSSLFKNPQLMVLMVVDLAKWCVKFVTAASAIFYFRDAMQSPALMVPYVLAIGIAATVGSFLLRFIAKKLSNRTSMILAMVGMGASLIMVYFMYANAIVVIVCLVLANFFYGMAYSVSPALYADTVVYSTWKTGKNAAGWIMGLQNLPLKVGVFMRGIIVNACLAATGWYKDIIYVGAERQSMTLALGLIPGIFCAVGAILLIVGFKITREKVMQYQAEIDARG